MTIAAGFVCEEGVLLCADTEHTGWTAKFHDSKLDHFEVPGGKIAFALAGNSSFAWSAIQKCRDRVQTIAAKEAIVEVEQILDAEYRRNVLGHPNYVEVGYELLVAVSAPPEPARLYATSETSLRKIADFECIGIGRELAGFIIRRNFLRRMHQQKALSLAAYALAAVKESVRGCGGMSIYLLLENDGRVGTVTSLHRGTCEQLEEYARVYDFVTRELLMAMTDEDKEDADFERYLTQTFCQRLLEVRSRWTAERKAKEAEFAALNPHLTPDEAKRIFREVSLGMVPRITTPQK